MASPPPQRTSASDAASPMPVVRIFNTQNDAVTTGTLLTINRATRGRSGVAGRVDGDDIAGLDSAERMVETVSSSRGPIGSCAIVIDRSETTSRSDSEPGKR